MIENKYDPKSIESKWQKFWEKEKLNAADDKNNKKPKFYCLDMFPYPSGDGLHVGHPEGYTATDIYCRYMRMNNYNVLHPMGWDAFGLPAENYAIKKGIHPKETTSKNILRFKKQIQSLGFSYDWNREINTSDPEYYKWTQWLFLELYKKGLAYQKKAPVNWCNNCKTVLAREQVIDGKCERCGSIVVQKELKQWFFKITDYAEKLLNDLKKLDWPDKIKKMQENWIGRSEGTLISFKVKTESEKVKNNVEVFTTRPDTIFGATYLVLAPEHEIVTKLKSKIENLKNVEDYINKTQSKTELERTSLEKVKTGVEIKGIKAINPATKKEIPIYIADYVLTTYGTGAIMAVPAHDERDHEFAKKYKLPIDEVIIEQLGKHLSHTTRRDVVKGIVINDGKVLVVQEHNGYYCLPGGTHEKKENDSQTLSREIFEESGYRVKMGEYIGQVEKYYFSSTENKNFVRLVRAYSIEIGNNNEPLPRKGELNSFWLDANVAIKKIESGWYPEDALFIKRRITKTNLCFTGAGRLINSGKYDGMDSDKAKEEITKFVGGEKSIQYRLKDWLISRQRYWGAPIPIIYCDKCGSQSSPQAIPVLEKDLPVELPNDVDFRPTGESPLARSKNFHNVKCPKCNSSAHRESDTMDTFVDSSWYFMRYTDPNNKLFFTDKKLLQKWLPVDLYIGGAEHAVMHLLYSRFITKVLRDLKYLEFSEPFSKLRNQGLILSSDGRKMSKSLGNVINPDEVVNEYGADTLRMYEMFIGPLEDAKPWDTKGIIGIKRFLDRVWKAAEKVKNEKEKVKTNVNNSNLLNLTIKKVSDDIKDLKFNTAISSMMIFLNEINKNIEISIEDYKKFILILSPFAPHISEELWNILGNKESIFLEKWPIFNVKSENEIIIPVQVNGKVRANIKIDLKYSKDQVEEIAKLNPNIIKYIVNKKIIKTIYVSGKIINIVI